MKYNISLLLSLSFLTACQPSPSSLPTISAETHSVKPQATVPVKPPFLKVQGQASFEFLVDSTGQMNTDALKTQFACDEVTLKTNLGRLTPQEPMAICYRSGVPSGESAPDGKDWLKVGGDIFRYTSVWYLVKDKDSVKSLVTSADFRARYAPVDSPEEALSFAFATLSPRYQLLTADVFQDLENLNSNYELELVASEVQATAVETSPEGYTIRRLLLDKSCNYSNTQTTAYAVDMTVSHAGELKEIARVPLYTLKRCPVV